MKEDPPMEWWKEGVVKDAPKPIPIRPPVSNSFNSLEPESYLRPEQQMSFQDSVENVFRNFLNFRDRASRSEFWWFQLFCLIVITTADFIDIILFVFPVFSTIVLLLLSLPNLAVTVRRLHDIGYSGWLLLLLLIPFLGSLFFIVALILMIQDGNPQINQYGKVPSNKVVR